MSFLTRHLFQIVERDFPSCTLSRGAAFLPMHSLDAGELSSTAAIEIARKTRQRAEDVAARLIEGLSGEIQATWRNDNGYVVCADVATPLLLAEVQETVAVALESISGTFPLDLECSRSIWCLMPDSTEPVYARIRLLSRALLQGLLAVVFRGRAQITITPLGSHQATSIRDVVELFQRAVEWTLEHEGEVRRDMMLPQGTCSGAVWTTHHYHERLSGASKKTLGHLRESQQIRVTMPADGWLLSRDRALSELLAPKSIRKVVDKILGHDGWLRFLFHLASTTPSGDFDPGVALFNECSSPLWNMRMLRDRFSRFGTWLPARLSKDALSEFIRGVEARRAFVLTGLFMPVYTARAIVHNEVAVWCAAVERFAREGHAFVNAPSTRLALEAKQVNDSAQEIAAGLGFGLSCIVPLIAGE